MTSKKLLDCHDGKQEPESLLSFDRLIRFLFMFFPLQIFMDWLMSSIAVHNGFYETNKFTNWLAQYVGIDISLSIHLLILLSLTWIVYLIWSSEKYKRCDRLVFIIMLAWNIIWIINNAISFSMLTT